MHKALISCSLPNEEYDTFADGARGIGRPIPIQMVLMMTCGVPVTRTPKALATSKARAIRTSTALATCRGARDPFTDGARSGNGQIAGMARTGVSSAPGNSLEQADFAA
ncbi:hypothetical protein ACTMU2_15055 [Cupriavidus basilensis]